MTAPPALSVRDLAHAYGDVAALRGVTLDVAPGERVGLLGANGSGKTTLMRAVSTLLVPDAGTVTVGGADARRDPAAVRRRIGVVFQSPALDDALTVRESLALQAALAGLGRGEARARIDDLLGRLDLADRADARVGTLSGGLARRADLARGLLHHPALVLLDEPTGGLDPLARVALWDTLDGLRRDHAPQAEGSAQLVATHLMDEAERCDRVAVLDAGRLVALGTPAALKAALGRDALWLDTDDAPALAARLGHERLDARAVGGRVLVAADDPGALLPALYARPDVRAAALKEPSMDDVFAAAVGGAFAGGGAGTSTPPGMGGDGAGGAGRHHDEASGTVPPAIIDPLPLDPITE
ncbi:ATP-binding cassette domain-containing protein [Rubrivirga sp. S365]|uniref:ABC transporter ATP-binding protein n=1 Tax=Rubrivirga sp. S365 TaxID=3076080 RepID=UPI0028CA7399|nr:ATP-binding cassette domain-containing protein [Rubrivirga sp. S365]MDT7856861.1 ATP-binding cassette domain-containing protein [Rubrivirga sp. S365]